MRFQTSSKLKETTKKAIPLTDLEWRFRKFAAFLERVDLPILFTDIFFI